MPFATTIFHTAERLFHLPLIGFDISERSIKYFKLKGGGILSIDVFGEIEIPEGVIENGEIKKEHDLAKLIKEWSKFQPWRVRAAYPVVSLPEEKSFLRVIQLPKIKIEEVEGAIRWELEANIPLPPDELIYDYEIIDPIEDHLDHVDVVVTAFPKTIIESYVRVFKEAGIQPYAFELESQAIIRSAIKELHSYDTKIIIDMGLNRTSFIIFSGGAIRFTETIPLGGRIFEENIAKTLKVTPEYALAIKKEKGLDKKAYDGELFASLVPAMGVYADELKRAISYYSDHAMHIHGAKAAIQQILLTGGDANLLGLDTYLAGKLKIPVERADPFISLHDRMTHTILPIPKNAALAFSTAIGLALRAIR